MAYLLKNIILVCVYLRFKQLLNKVWEKKGSFQCKLNKFHILRLEFGGKSKIGGVWALRTQTFRMYDLSSDNHLCWTINQIMCHVQEKQRF